MNLLVADVGTSSMRMTLVDENSRFVETRQIKYCPVFLKDGLVEQDPGDWERALYSLAAHYAGKYTVDAIALTAQRSSVIPVDAGGQTLTRAIMWQDRRNADIVAVLREHDDTIVRLSGSNVNTVFSGPKMTWIKHQLPNIYDRTYKFLVIADYLVYKMTGEFRTDDTYGSRSLLMDLRTGSWSPELLDIFGLPGDKLCEIVPCGSIIGRTSEDFAALTGIKSGTPVVTCGGDQQCGALGQGVFHEGVVSVNSGTGAYLTADTDRLPDTLAVGMTCSRAAFAGHFILESSVLTCGAALDWFCREFYDSEPSAVLDDQLPRSSPGASGLVTLPYFQGASAPNWNNSASALISGLRLSSTRADMLRSLAEGICCDISTRIDELNKTQKITRVNVSGGLSLSESYNQLQADVYGHSIVLRGESQPTTLGAWINAATALGVVSGVDEAWRRIESRSQCKTWNPDQERHRIYVDLGKKLRKLYADNFGA